MKRIVVVEDDKISQTYIKRALEGLVDVEIADTVASGMEAITKSRPDSLILDVELPDGTGYDLCTKLREQSDYEHIPILFISGHASLNERIKGYEVGADDYISKPFESTELTAKVKALLRHHHHKQELYNQYSQAHATAMESMTGASEMGLIVQFVERTYSINNFEQLSQLLFSVMQRIGLNSSLMFQTDNEQFFFTSQAEGDISPLEQELLKQLREQGRLFHFGSRTQVNFPSIACLIKNMPTQDQIRYGRYKDMLPPILACANQKVRQIEIEMMLQDHTMRFSSSFKRIRDTLDDVATKMKTGQENGSSMLNKLLDTMHDHMPRLGLDDDQEHFLLTNIESKVNESLEQVRFYETTQVTFDSLIELLQHLVDEQVKIVDRIISKEDLINTELQQDDELKNGPSVFL